MGIEQRLAQIRDSRNISKTTLEMQVALLTVGPIISLLTNKLNAITPKEFAPGFTEEYVRAIKDGCFPVFVANHQSQFDLPLLARVSRVLINTANRVLPEEKRISGTLVPMAQSVENGAQGIDTQIIYAANNRQLERNKVVTIPTATVNDTGGRGELPNPREFTTTMRDGIKKGYGAIGVFPEGTKEGGRIGENGQRKGMQEFAQNSLRICISLARSNGQPVVFIPVGISESWRVLDPQTRLPRSNTLMAGFGIGHPKLPHVRIGMPVRTDKDDLSRFIIQKNWSGLDAYIGGKIAELLPFRERGKYRI